MATIKAIIFFTWIAFGLGTLVYAVMATEPNRFIIFKEPILDKSLPDHVIRTEKVANEGSCRVKCYLEPNCVSLNVGPADEGGHTCELNNATDESSTQSNLKERQHYVHYAIENVCHVHGDPCPGENNLCQVGFTDKGYRCKCREGYEYAGGNDCLDIDECHLELYNCNSGMECVNEPGHTKDGAICLDNDECELDSSHSCPPNSQCVNEPGSFRCDCDPGFIKDGASCKENWKKINHDPVCFKARDDSYGSFNITESGLIYTFKLVHRSGALKCARKLPASYWGCAHWRYWKMKLAIFITFPNKTTLLPVISKEITGPPRYKIHGVDISAMELVFNNLPSPMFVTTGREFQIWFGEDLRNWHENDNSGKTCADVYAWYA